MTYTPTIYDWPPDVAPVDQFFRAGGLAVGGGMTLGGASVESPEPGGRGELMLAFPRFALAATNRRASWLLSRLMNGAVFKVQLWYPSVQLLAGADALGAIATGINWSNNLGWANSGSGYPWRANPSAPVVTGAAKGTTTFTLNMDTGAVNLGRTLEIGHVIGLYQEGLYFTHIITDVQTNSSNFRATVTVQPPLRRALTTAHQVLFRPSMNVTCANARELANNFRWGQTVQMNDARLVEALV